MDNELMKTEQTAITEAQVNEPTGLEDSDAADVIIPRLKVINALSPERVDGVAEEGAILNSLTQEDVSGKNIILLKQYYSNIHWNPDRDADPRMFCRSYNGTIGENSEGLCTMCKDCKKNQFDNTKTGKASQPQCTKYLNFIGFVEGVPMPVVLSFSRTNYKEGQKLLSIARSMMKPLWYFKYKLGSTQMTKGKNKWYIMTTAMNGVTDEETRSLAKMLFDGLASVDAARVDYENMQFNDNDSTVNNIDPENIPF